MDAATILGIVFAFSLMGYAVTESGAFSFFINAPALMIVLGGTLGACLVYYPLGKILGIVSVLKKAFVTRDERFADRIKLLGDLSQRARRQGILSLSGDAARLKDPFFKRCMQMAIDGTDPDDITRMMGREIASTAERHRLGADIFSTMGTFAPAMGMIGTLIGLVNMLRALDNPANIGPAMAVALLSTLYGAVLANLVFFPLSGKLRYRSWREMVLRELTLEGVVSVAAGDHPAVLEQKLMTFITPDMATESAADHPARFGKGMFKRRKKRGA